MYSKVIYTPTTLVVNKSIVGERIEDRVFKMVYENQPISDGAPLIYTDRRKGVEPQYNIRTDRFDIALTANDKLVNGILETRENFYKPDEKDTSGIIPNGSTDATA